MSLKVDFDTKDFPRKWKPDQIVMKILCNFFSWSYQFIKDFLCKIEGDFNFFVNFLRAPKARSRAACANKRRKLFSVILFVSVVQFCGELFLFRANWPTRGAIKFPSGSSDSPTPTRARYRRRLRLWTDFTHKPNPKILPQLWQHS